MNKTTKSAQFTPGPWSLCNWMVGNNTPTGEVTICGPEGDEHICTMDGNEDNQANGNLIAAAPAMYAIIKDMREAFYVKGTRKALLEVMERSKDVIAQAEGRQG